MKPIKKFEPLPTPILHFFYHNVHFIIDGEIDQAFGAGVINGTTKAVWTTKGKRIEASMGGGTLIFSQSRKVDPLYTERKKELACPKSSLVM